MGQMESPPADLMQLKSKETPTLTQSLTLAKFDT